MKRVAVIVAAVLLLGSTVYWVSATQKRAQGTVLSGAIEARDIEVGSLVGGRVLRVEVEEGQRVEGGQVLVVLEPDLFDLQIEEQEGVLRAARAALARVLNGPRPEEIARARVDWENAERERVRLESLLRQGIVGQQAYDDAAARAEVARATFEELERGSRREDIAEARANVEREAGRLAYLRRTRAETVVTAPAAGTIESIDLRPGDLVPANRPVARLLEPGELWVRVYVPEPKLGLVRLGQEAAVSVDTFPDREFRGRVVEIRDQAEYVPRNIQTLDQRNDQVFGVKVAIDPAPELKAGMAALVRLLP